MLKLLGIIGLVISCGLFGISRSTNLKLRIELLEDYYQMVLTLKSQINYFKEPLPDILSKTEKNGESKAFSFIKEIGSEMTKKSCHSVNFWQESLNSFYEDTVLTEDDIKIMSYLGEFIGQTDYANHMHHFAYLEGNLLKQIRQVNDLYLQKSPMYNRIGFFIGALIGILLI